MKSLKKLLILLIAGFTLIGTIACRETMEGAEDDIEDAADAVEDSVN